MTSCHGDGVQQRVDHLFIACLTSFSEGFNRVFQMEKMSSFSHKEVQMILCGNQSPSWTADDIINYTEPKLGYTRDRYLNTGMPLVAGCSLTRPLPFWTRPTKSGSQCF